MAQILQPAIIVPIEINYIDQTERGKSRNECQISQPRWWPVPPAATRPAPGHGPAGAGRTSPLFAGEVQPSPGVSLRPERQNPAPPPWCFRSPVSLVVPHLPCCFRSGCLWLFPALVFFGVLCLCSPVLVFSECVLGSPALVFSESCVLVVFPVKKIEKLSGKHAVATADGCPRRARQGRERWGTREPAGRPRACPVAGGLSTAGAVA